MGAAGRTDWDLELVPRPALVEYGFLTATYQVGVLALVILREQDKYLLTLNLNGLEHYIAALTIERLADGTY